jgi:hypothetical protein
LPVLFTLTTTACATKPKAEIILPPKPERVEMPEPTDLKDLAKLLNYYEHLVQDWEAWGDTATRMIENPR